MDLLAPGRKGGSLGNWNGGEEIPGGEGKNFNEFSPTQHGCMSAFLSKPEIRGMETVRSW